MSNGKRWGCIWGWDRPLVVQYLSWLGRAVQGDLGTSLRESRPVTEAIAERLPNTLKLGAAAWVLSVLIGWPLGVISAANRGTIWDYAARFIAFVGQATPNFWIAIIGILIFSVELGWLPVGRMGGWKHFVMPVVVLGTFSTASQLRLMRTAMLDTLDQEYIKLARAKGVQSWKVIWKHAMRNALIPPVTLTAILLAGFLNGAIIVETVYAWPGIGRLAVEAAFNDDFPLLQGIILFVTFLYVVAQVIVDIAYVLIDPRVRLT